jgi:hypothetical protein
MLEEFKRKEKAETLGERVLPSAADDVTTSLQETGVG